MTSIIDVSDIPMPTLQEGGGEESAPEAGGQDGIPEANPADVGELYMGMPIDEARELGLLSNEEGHDPINGDDAPTESENPSDNPAAPLNATPANQSQTPAKLDPMQAMITMLAQNQQKSDERIAALLERLAPKQETKVVEPDIEIELPPEFNTPELQGYGKALIKQAMAMADARVAKSEKALDDRVQAAKNARETNEYHSQAVGVATKLLSNGFDFTGHDAARERISDFLKDAGLIISHVHGGAPGDKEKILDQVVNDLVNAKIRGLNSKAKAKVQAQGHRPAATKIAPSGISQNGQRPTLAEARAAGYKTLFEAGLDFDKKILEMRARQSRGQ